MESNIFYYVQTAKVVNSKDGYYVQTAKVVNSKDGSC